jgi:hypothetical protein
MAGATEPELPFRNTLFQFRSNHKFSVGRVVFNAEHIRFATDLAIFYIRIGGGQPTHPPSSGCARRNPRIGIWPPRYHSRTKGAFVRCCIRQPTVVYQGELTDGQRM